jgi:hypothetical protein
VSWRHSKAFLFFLLSINLKPFLSDETSDQTFVTFVESGDVLTDRPVENVPNRSDVVVRVGVVVVDVVGDSNRRQIRRR